MDQQQTQSADGQTGGAAESPRIIIQENGPYRVAGGPLLTRRDRVLNEQGEAVDWAKGEDCPARERFSLCRCGHSEKKPFCDGSHRRAGFDGMLTADRADSATRRKVYPGAGLTLTDDESLCAGYAFCDRHGGVWDEVGRTADPQVRQNLMLQVEQCPSGRLQVILGGDVTPFEVRYGPTIAVIPNGPLWVLGGVPVEAPDGFTYEVRNRMLLCRCGQSKNKPFCDGSHWQSQFTAP